MISSIPRAAHIKLGSYDRYTLLLGVHSSKKLKSYLAEASNYGREFRLPQPEMSPNAPSYQMKVSPETSNIRSNQKHLFPKGLDTDQPIYSISINTDRTGRHEDFYLGFKRDKSPIVWAIEPGDKNIIGKGANNTIINAMKRALNAYDPPQDQ